MPYIKPTSDIFIKYLFGKEEHSRTLIDFINAVQQNGGFPLIKSVEIKNPVNLKNLYDDKDSVLNIQNWF